MNDSFAENLAKLCQKADQPPRVTDVVVAATAAPPGASRVYATWGLIRPVVVRLVFRTAPTTPLGRFSGLTIAGLSRSRLPACIYAFEAVVGLTRGVVFPLIADVVGHPWQVLGPGTDHTVAGLPCEAVAVDDALVEVVGAGAFELADPVAHRQRERSPWAFALRVVREIRRGDARRHHGSEVCAPSCATQGGG